MEIFFVAWNRSALIVAPFWFNEIFKQNTKWHFQGFLKRHSNDTGKIALDKFHQESHCTKNPCGIYQDKRITTKLNANDFKLIYTKSFSPTFFFEENREEQRLHINFTDRITIYYGINCTRKKCLTRIHAQHNLFAHLFIIYSLLAYASDGIVVYISKLLHLHCVFAVYFEPCT